MSWNSKWMWMVEKYRPDTENKKEKPVIARVLKDTFKKFLELLR